MVSFQQWISESVNEGATTPLQKSIVDFLQSDAGYYHTPKDISVQIKQPYHSVRAACLTMAKNGDIMQDTDRFGPWLSFRAYKPDESS